MKQKEKQKTKGGHTNMRTHMKKLVGLASGLFLALGMLVMNSTPVHADFDVSNENTVAGSIAAGVFFGRDANRFRLHRESGDLTPKFSGDFLERADLGHVAFLPWLGPHHRGLDAHRWAAWGRRRSP